MAPKSAPFKVVVHFSGLKSAAEIENLYADFYLEQVKRTLMSSNLSERGIKLVMDKLLANCKRIWLHRFSVSINL